MELDVEKDTKLCAAERKLGRGSERERDLELDADRKIRREKWRLTRRETNLIGCRQRNRATESSREKEWSESGDYNLLSSL